MNGVWPKGRTARAGGVALALLLLPACAHGGASAASLAATQAAASAAEVDALKAQLAAREQTVSQLEGRLAMLEAAQRQLRAELEAERTLPPLQEAAARELGARETVRIGARAREGRAVAPPVPTTVSPPAPASEARPVLRLSGDRRESEHRELTSSWATPTTSDRLLVSPVPALSSPASRVGSQAQEPHASTGRPSATSAASRAPGAGGATPAAPVATSLAATKPEADDLYLHALDLLRRRELPEALRELDAFVSASPSDPRIARAQFWRGELLFAEHQFARALSAYEQALRRDSTGDKAADTLLRIARCHRRLGESDRARAALLRLRTQFPDSAAARQAEHEPEPTVQEDT
jgi:tol-pal system protein YbgF